MGFRKTIKRPKESFKIGKEIANIRNCFEKINLKNQIMLKNAVKLVDNIKSDESKVACSDESNALGKEEEKYLQEISQMNLTVQNDSEFKLCDKQNISRTNTMIKHQKKSTKICNNGINDNENIDNEFNINKILKIECRKLTALQSPIQLAQEEIIMHGASNRSNGNEIGDNIEKFDYTTSQSENPVKDLNSLLVMMGVSTVTAEQREEIGNILSRYDTAEECNRNSYTNLNLEVVSKSAKLIDIREVLNVTQIRIDITSRQEALLKKYVSKWKEHMEKKKVFKKQQREQAMNCFFDKLTKRKMSICATPESPGHKAKLIARDYNRYRQRYQMQKHIIALQKAKLEEQNRIIEELKCNRIVEASKMSVDTMKQEVRKTYYGMDRNLKPKLKTLTNELKVEIEEPALVLHCLKVPQFLQRMEKRAREREEKHAIIRERRNQMEEERIRLKQQEELARAQMDKEEKEKRIKELKDKRKREKIENIRKKHHAERMRALTVMADLHYEKTLKIRYAIRPLKLLLAIKRDNVEKAKEHYKFQLKKNVFLNWMWYTEDMIFERNFKAESFHHKKIMGKCLGALKKNHHNLVLKKQVAEDYYDLFVVNLVFRKFREAAEVVKREQEMKWHKAVLYHTSNLLFRSFSCWRTLPALNALKREQEARKSRWREKVLQVVPDYSPPED